MKSRDFAKLAMMGLVGGCLLGSTQSAEAANTNTSNNKGVLLAHACRGEGGCHGSPSTQGSRSFVADNSDDEPTTRKNNQNDPDPQDDNNNNPQKKQNQPTAAGCAVKSSPNKNNRQNQQTAAGCAVKSRPNNDNRQNQQTAAGCAVKSRPNTRQNQQTADNNSSTTKNSNFYTIDHDAQSPAQEASAKEFAKELNPATKAIFDKMTPQGKNLAMKINSDCKGKNDCKGQGKGETCAGKNSCKGQSTGPVDDKNMAVKAAAKAMAEKRNNANEGNKEE